MVANATGCSSIYGGNLPTTPWTTGADGRGPAWSNSLFEDNAEFGLGFRLAADGQTELARRRLAELRDAVGAELVDGILQAPQLRESELRAQRERVSELMRRLDGLLDRPAATDLVSVVDHLVRRSVWIVGGDAYGHCIAHGIEMRNGLDQQYRAVASGYWPLIRYDPIARAAGGNPFLLDSPRPRIPAGRLHRPRAALPLAREHQSGRGGTVARPGRAGGRSALGRLRGDGDPRRAPVPGRRPQGSVMKLLTDYMGLALRNPLVASASPLSRTVDGVRRLADASAYGP